jgi:hypothetical protein
LYNVYYLSSLYTPGRRAGMRVKNGNNVVLRLATRLLRFTRNDDLPFSPRCIDSRHGIHCTGDIVYSF